ncbi:hypothetical protein BDY19DRAFT_906102 [Irpex rosettiformis]|uniref:Uncharacterized protein n=1 Tax=Irpex rosettiformis TaxID=378272 RepID=A0ACB8U4Q9_9APHY|nr:hypothetical protein BDY19DRAFT_906102 [Irpex rosettiformis]
MGLFYAYAKTITDDWSSRYLIVFASRTVADEWWRAVSTSTVPNYATTIRRVTPQYYTYNAGLANIATTITTAGVAQQFLGTVFFTLLNDRDGRILSVIPPLTGDVADHINGNWFYIRSKGPNPVYWYATPSGQIVASRTQSTRFRISATDKSLNNAVLIGNDQINIATTGGLSVNVSNYGNLQVSGKADTFRFGDLTSGFRVNAYGNELLPGVSSNAVVKTSENDAQEWELTEGGVIDGNDDWDLAAAAATTASA